jgi:outer membrane protein TolC
MINSSIATAKKLDESIRGRIKSGMVNSADLYSSAAAVLKYQIAYEELKSEINILETELDIFFGSSLKNSISPDDSEFSLYYKKSLKAGYPEIKFENTANAEIFRITKNNLKYTADISENRLLPKLDLVGEYTKKSENKSFSGSVGNLDSSDYYIGFAFSYPLQNTENRSKAEEIRLSIEELNSEYAISEDSYVKSLNAVKTRYNDSVRLINLREKRIETLEEKYRFEMKKYQQSQLDLEILINTSVEIANEKITLVRLKKQIIENYIDYMDLTGRGEDL